jgi:RNA polymerase sigma-70 factor (ECF subfamily)
VTLTLPDRARNLPRVSAAPSPDGVLLARIGAGDELALGAVYDHHAALVHGVARRVTRDEQLARDITQEVFIYLWELPGRVDLARGTLRAYLAMVAHRRAVDEVRRSERRSRIESGAATADIIDGPEHAVLEESMQQWRRHRLAEALDALPAEQRRALELAYYDGLTYKQVAITLGIPEGTAKSRLRLAMARLRELLGDDVRAAI